MNPISNLVCKEFKDLGAHELMQVIGSYCDNNRYEYNYNFNYKTVKDVVKFFESNFYHISKLESYFNYWTK